MLHDSLTFRKIVEASQDVVWTLDPRQMVYTYVSPSVVHLLGWTPEELIGKPASTVLQPDDFVTIRGLIDHVLAHPDAQPASRAREFDQPHKDGRLVPTEVVTTVMLDADGRFAQLLGVSRDISRRRRADTDRRALESRLLQAHKLESLAVLAGGVAHEFNNLLTSILGHADLALQDLPGDSAAAQSLAAIETASRRAAAISRQLLAYSGRGRFVVGPVALPDLVDDLGRTLELTVAGHATLEVSLPPDLPSVDADEEQLRLMVTNLVSNAAEAIGQREGAIRLSGREVESTAERPIVDFLGHPLPAGPYVVLEVADNGIGMDADVKARLFDPFFSTKFVGRGLGLAAVLGVVRGHRGAIDVESRPDRGTTFRVYLPAIRQRRAAGQSDTAAASARTTLGTVLVVDDEPAVRAVAMRMVEHSGFAAVGATDGQEAVDLVRGGAHKRFDCVLLDLTMPRMGGEEALRHIRTVAADLPVVICSGYPAQELGDQFAALHVAAFLQKPYRLVDIRDTLQELFGLP